MKQRYYAANNGKALLQIITELGKADLTIAVADNKLNWKTIYLSKEQTKGLLIFLNENVIS